MSFRSWRWPWRTHLLSLWNHRKISLENLFSRRVTWEYGNFVIYATVARYALIATFLNRLPRRAHCDRVRVHLGSHKGALSECACVRPLLAHWLGLAVEHDLWRGGKRLHHNLLLQKGTKNESRIPLKLTYWPLAKKVQAQNLVVPQCGLLF
jgi:hypothetical protein